MKRIDLIYNGVAHTVSNRTVEEFRAEVDAALAASTPQWLTVNYGEGRANTAQILITPYTALTIITNDYDAQNHDEDETV
ncbi:hypothetical protein EDF36_2413 [Rathayibacter sp. PhB152]|uniref:hypothetical protein n=1 Tax=unclassified Rathayibacter TaxID=2609250 RepID=UPI000F4BCFC8|nr:MULTISPECIES: hypothetical protein [unclassified Rathayibacter]ROQ58958.1 hypothetical protein EDF36_2413 [Rathayibacter sp. PhB152]ROS30039.1 hypothetical protein EDF22_1798 [Rathayibacter sp. PhB127]TDX79124.1 hypothetical protein EDF35_2356 [Rathayibacter sp. PhB151]